MTNDSPYLPNLGGIHILVVEDDADTRLLLGALLELTGARVTPAESAATALIAFEGGPVDLVVSDVGLPDADGFEFLSKLRASGDRGARVPAIALTAFAGRDRVAEALASGYQVHLTKPIEEAKLYRAIETLVRGIT